MALNMKSGTAFRLELTPFNATRDVAECIDFARPLAGARVRFDLRGEDQLCTDAFEAVSAMERERALWELSDRLMGDAAPLIDRFINVEEDPAARRHALWLLVQVLGEAATPRLEALQRDDDPEVIDWARTLLSDIDAAPRRSVYDTARIVEAGAFDQTLPLLISGHVLVQLPGVGVVETRLSPLWFESIMGRVMACTNQTTIWTDLVIEKAIRGMHPDGTDHFEIYRFSGMSSALSESQLEHHYLSLTQRPFYPSGRVEEGPWVAAPIELERVAATTFARTRAYEIDGDGERAERMASSSMPFVTSVRGRYHGWAAVNLQSVLDQGTVLARDVQLANPTDPVAGPLTNARLYGIFRGKLSDHTGDGVVDVNTIRCHGTVDGEHDLHCDGTKLADPFM
jgi:hypothetical protein